MEIDDKTADFKLDPVNLLRCSTLTFNKYTCDLLAVAFTKSELGSSSVTGKISNLHRKKGLEAKNKLCPKKLQAVLCK